MKEKQEKLKEDEQRNSAADVSVGYGLNYTAHSYIRIKISTLNYKMLSKALKTSSLVSYLQVCNNCASGPMKFAYKQFSSIYV